MGPSTRLTATVLAALVLALLAMAPSAGATARSCGDIAFAPASEDGVFDIRARGTSCRKARRVARAVRPLSITRGPYEYRSGGYACRGRYEDEGLPAVGWRCRKRGARISFSRS